MKLVFFVCRVLCIGVLCVGLLSACGSKEASAPQASASSAASASVAATPAASAILPAPDAMPAGLASAADPARQVATTALGTGLGAPEKLYKAICALCHDTGVAGAPKLGDKQAWEPRVATGMSKLMQSVYNGKNAMPPKGTALNATDAELQAVVQYMVDAAK